MSVVDKALETQLKNIQIKTGKSLAALKAIVKKSGLTQHGKIRDMLKRDLNLGHGDANALTHFVLKDGSPATHATPAAAIDEVYSGAKAELRPIHDKLMAVIAEFGPLEIAPKKGYLSLRRKKQFAMIGPTTTTRVDVGLNMNGVRATARLVAMPAGGMCQYQVKVMQVKEVDKQLADWLKLAYDSAG